MEAVLGTPHGAELMDAGFAISGDLVTEGEARIVALLAGWLARAGSARGIGTPGEIAQTIIAALKGLKLGRAIRRLSRRAAAAGTDVWAGDRPLSHRQTPHVASNERG